MKKVAYKEIFPPEKDCSKLPVMLTNETMKKRYQKVINKMVEKKYDAIVIYADLEHGSNFEYLTGFLPRFEEALLVMHVNKENYMIMGNENLNKVSKARLASNAIHSPYFSLPNQPMENTKSFLELLEESNLKEGQRIGIVGWKNFTSRFENNKKLFDVPHYIIEKISKIVGEEIYNATDLFIGNTGVRCTNNVNEIEHYEFGASLASDSILDAIDAVEIGVSELELGDKLNRYGQKNNVITIAASGPRFLNANIYPTEKTVNLQDPISLTVGYKGGLSSRAGIVIENEKQLPENQRDYLDRVVKPYYSATVEWLENIHCGMLGGDLYSLIERELPKEEYHWTLNPGHLCADEEWMSSPIYKDSKEILESGMILQLDFIPSVSGYFATNAESSIVIADTILQEKIQNESPSLWKRMMNRRKYIENELNIKLHKDVLPLASTLGYLRPYLLCKEKAMSVML